MSQIDIFELLIIWAKTGEHKHFTVEEIKKGLKKRGLTDGLKNVNKCCVKLWQKGYLEMKGAIWRRDKSFKLKDFNAS